MGFVVDEGAIFLTGANRSVGAASLFQYLLSAAAKMKRNMESKKNFIGVYPQAADEPNPCRV